jgi:hypothetical protein
LVVLCLLGAVAVALWWTTGWKARPRVVEPVAKTLVPPQPIAVAPPTPTVAPLIAMDGFGRVTGKIHFLGEPPQLPPINRSCDVYCGKTRTAPDESIVVNPNRTLRNVLVRIEGAPATPPPSEDLIVTQQDCAYRPRVAGIVAGQHVLIQNGDQTLHNVHAFRGRQSWFNQAQLAGSAPIRKDPVAGAVIKLKCDVHPWMTGFVRVQVNSLFAVTDENGRFSIEKIPAGRYTLVAWQETLGERSREVVVERDRVVEMELDFENR